MITTKQNAHWAELYRRALFEDDHDKLPLLLEEAHQAVHERLRELWYSPTAPLNVTEKELRELDAAAYYLALLKSLEMNKALQGDGR